jgi:Cleft lip and palate transmembrane protein 1 (CLPTM1)
MLGNVRAEGELFDLPIHDCLVLTRYLPRPKIRKERNLLQHKIGGVDEQEEPEVRSGALTVNSLLPDGQAPDTIVSFWHQVRSAIYAASNTADVFRQNLTLALVSDAAVLQYAQSPPPITERKSTSYWPDGGWTYRTNRCSLGSWTTR